ncbi:hypothetical protein BaRGS_00026252 [Batillaria attramentaria]|uniref:Uncharacterized protein n=1 Tax=Batillaria attramentaria TaxID=370345 RepID=A0ABD0K5B1_9CAEN
MSSSHMIPIRSAIGRFLPDSSYGGAYTPDRLQLVLIIATINRDYFLQTVGTCSRLCYVLAACRDKAQEQHTERKNHLCERLEKNMFIDRLNCTLLIRSTSMERYSVMSTSGSP